MLVRRLRHLVGAVARMLVILATAAGAGVVAILIAYSGGSISCVPPLPPAHPDPIPRWAIAAGAPALVAALVGAYFGLGAETAWRRWIGLAFAVAVGAGTFYGVYSFLPAACRP